MTRKSRRILFYISVAVFGVVSYVTLMYALGYKYSVSSHKFVQTGAIYLKSSTDAKVFVGDKLQGATSFIGNSIGINRLLPGQYAVRLQKDGFFEWQKSITVEAGKVSEFTRILLLPQSEDEVAKLASEALDDLNAPAVVPAPTQTPKPRKPSPSVSPSPSPAPFYIKAGTLYRTADDKPEELAKNVLGFSIDKGNDKVLWWTAHELWVMWLNDTDYQPYRTHGDKTLITRLSASIKRAAWFRDEDHIVLDANGYRIIEIDTRGGINIVKL